jgi:putative oxidoreductase
MSPESLIVSGLQGLLGLVGLLIGGVKVAGQEEQVAEFERFGYPQWFRIATGTIEIAAGTALVVGLLWLPALAPAGGVLLGIVMVGAVATHLRIGDPASKWAAPALLFALATTLIVLQYPASL